MDFVDRMTSAFVSGVSGAFYAVSRGAAEHLPGLLGALAVLLAAWVAGRVTYALVRRMFARASTQGHVDVLLARLARGTVLMVGAVVALAVAGVNVAALVTSLGLAGLTLGFALRDVLANSVAGIMLLIQRPFRIGDTIVVAGTEGVVTDVRVRDTVLRTPDGRVVFVPNITVFNGVVVNLSAESVRRFQIAVWVPAGGDLEADRVSALAAVESTPGVLEEPPADTRIAAVGPERARLVARGWVDTAGSSMTEVQSAALTRVRGALGGAGTAVPVGGQAAPAASGQERPPASVE